MVLLVGLGRAAPPWSSVCMGGESVAGCRATYWGESLAGWSFMAPRLIPVGYVQMVGLVYMTTQCACVITEPEPRGAGN